MQIILIYRQVSVLIAIDLQGRDLSTCSFLIFLNTNSSIVIDFYMNTVYSLVLHYTYHP